MVLPIQVVEVLAIPSIAYSPQLGARLSISQTQLNFIGVAASCRTSTFFKVHADNFDQFYLVGSSLSSPILGRIIDSYGPRIPIACAFVFHIIGYAAIKQLYDSGLPPHVTTLPTLIFVALVLCTLLVGSGGTAADLAAVNSTAKTFPDRAVTVY